MSNCCGGTAWWGTPGQEGPQGPKGDPGKDGATPNITIGTVRTGTPARVFKRGTVLEPIFDFVLPGGGGGEGTPGPQGPAGPAGSAGPAGPAGPTGPAGPPGAANVLTVANIADVPAGTPVGTLVVVV